MKQMSQVLHSHWFPDLCLQVCVFLQTWSKIFLSLYSYIGFFKADINLKDYQKKKKCEKAASCHNSVLEKSIKYVIKLFNVPIKTVTEHRVYGDCLQQDYSK